MKLKGTAILSVIFLGVVIGQFALMNHKLLKTRKSLGKKFKTYRQGQAALMFALTKSTSTSFPLPKEFDQVPYSDGDTVLEVKTVQLRNVFAPYNASIIEKNDNGFFLFYRYDTVRQMHCNKFDSYIGCAELDVHFRQTEKEVIHINTQSSHSEDPRVIKNQADFYLIYNDGPYGTLEDRKMHITQLDSETLQPLGIMKMDPNLASVEKNWVPFSYQDMIHFEYQLFHPRKVLRLENADGPTLVHMKSPLPIANIDWETRWGKPLGGTSARLVDGQYLAFFHSKFKDTNDTCWYVMGAYTFEAKPPFRVTAMSETPLIFKGIYQTESINTADPQKFVIYPCGYAIKTYDDKTLLHLACGENDSAVKIVTIDKDKLLKSLKKISSKTGKVAEATAPGPTF